MPVQRTRTSRTMDLLRRHFERLSLPGQVLLLGALAGGLTTLLSQLLAQGPTAEQGVWMLATTLVTLGAAWWPARRAARAHGLTTLQNPSIDIDKQTEVDDLAMAERNRAARDLHDAVSQTLFAAHLLAGTLSRDEHLSEAARGQVAALERLNKTALAEMRMMLFELRPDALESARLPELLQHAVEAFQGRSGVDVIADIAPEPAPPARLREEVYRIAQEALSNIGRHSRARHVHVGWTVLAGGRGRLHIVDDGCGFDMATEHPGHFGLDHMQDRARSVGAHLTIKSAPSEGTELLLETNWS